MLYRHRVVAVQTVTQLGGWLAAHSAGMLINSDAPASRRYVAVSQATVRTGRFDLAGNALGDVRHLTPVGGLGVLRHLVNAFDKSSDARIAAEWVLLLFQ